jgi:hypothetical protein
MAFSEMGLRDLTSLWSLAMILRQQRNNNINVPYVPACKTTVYIKKQTIA